VLSFRARAQATHSGAMALVLGLGERGSREIQSATEKKYGLRWES